MNQQKDTHPSINYIPADLIYACDYEEFAQQFIKPETLAYIDGGSGLDKTLFANRKVFDDFAIKPSSFTNQSQFAGETGSSDTTQFSTASTLLGQTFKHPIALAPLAYQTLVHKDGELATAAAAEATDTLMISSTLSSYSMEQIAEKTGRYQWFQLYIQPEPHQTAALIKRAVSAGYQAIVVTVDAAIQVPSRRAVRAGFRMPENLIPVNIAGQKMSNNFRQGRSVFETFALNSVNCESIKMVLNLSPVPVLVKGVVNPQDAESLKEMGVAGIIVSNHGGRTMDGVPASLSVLPDIRAVLGVDYPILFDSGIRSGSDAYKAIALGADAVLIGRLQVYALAVAGALGVGHMIKLLRQELELAMAVSGCHSIAQIKQNNLYQYN